MERWESWLATALREFEWLKQEEGKLFAALRKAERGLDFALRIKRREAWFEMREKAQMLNCDIVRHLEAMPRSEN